MKKRLYALLFIGIYSLQISLAQSEPLQPYNSCLDDEYFFDFENNSKVQAPISSLEIPLEIYRIDAQKAHLLKPNPETTITIPSNAFLDSKGNIIDGEVEVFYRDFKNPIEIFLSGIPMTVSRGQKEIPFQSAGMFELKAAQNGKAVFPNPDALISVEMTSLQTDSDFDLYTLNETEGNWENQGRSALATQNIDPMSFRSVYPQEGMPREPQQRYAHLNIFTLTNSTVPARKSHIKELQFAINASKTKFKTSSIKDSLFLTKSFGDLGQLSTMIWIYDGDNRKEMAEKINDAFTTKINSEVKGIFKERVTKKRASIPPLIPRDIIIEPNPKEDNYLVQVIRKSDTLTIPAYPYFNTSTPTIEQKRNEKFFETYQANLQKRMNQWANLDNIYEDQKASFDKKMEDYEGDLAAQIAWQALQETDDRYSKNAYSKREVLVSTFGILNIDKLLKLMEPEQILAIKNADNQPIDIKNIYLLDRTNNAVLTYPTEKIRFVRSAQNSLIVLTKNGEIGMVSPESFALAIESKQGKTISLTTAFLPAEGISKSTLTDALAMK